MGLLGDGSSSGGEQDDQMLRLPDYEPNQADKMPEDHFFGMPPKARDIEDEIDRSWLAELDHVPEEVAKLQDCKKK